MTFKREIRYAVIKYKDLSPEDRRALSLFLRARNIPTRECVVVEADWPEYEPVWAMIQARMEGSPYPEGHMLRDGYGNAQFIPPAAGEDSDG